MQIYGKPCAECKHNYNECCRINQCFFEFQQSLKLAQKIKQESKEKGE